MEAPNSSTDTDHSSYHHNPLWSTSPNPQSSSPANNDTPTNGGPGEGSQERPSAAGNPFPSSLDLLPFLYPQQSNIYQAQLLHYNKLISPTRGGGLQSSALPPAVPAAHPPPTSRSRASSRVSQKDAASAKGNQPNGHGSRSRQHTEKNRANATVKDGPSKMPNKKSPDLPRSNPPRPVQTSSAAVAAAHGPAISSSVPSTPRQHARKYSFESREPSPNDNSHSPRSAYSETNSTLPSLRPLPPKNGGCRYETALTQTRRRIPYTTGNDRLERLDLRTVKAKLTEDEEKKLATDMREVYDRLLPTSAVEEKRLRLVNKLETIFNDEWPGHNIKVRVFGSSGNLLCHDGSDVDLCITTEWKELENVCKIADLLARRGMQKVVCISMAKVPIVKIWDPELGLACDMNVNNTLALENTRMIRVYMEIDPRVRELAMIVKHWTRRRIINDAGIGGTLSSYTWICLIIAFLQLRDPPILPALHQLPYRLPKEDGSRSAFADDLSKLQGFGRKNESSAADLLFQFFRFYAHEFDYSKHVLSIRTGKLLPKLEKRWDIGMTNSLCVEEPFSTSRNLGNTADEYSFRGLHQELRRAFDLISTANLSDACEQFVFPKEEERTFTRPPPQSRPVPMRSSSQSNRGGRGNHRGHRNNNFNRNGGSSRRASSSVPTHDNNMFMSPIAMAQDMSWYTTQYPFQYTQQDLITQMAYHQESLRHLQMYAQPSYMQQSMSQRSNSATSVGQSSERSRTNSFDTAPVNSPLRPDLYALYTMNAGQAFYPQYGTYPSSPATTTAATGPQDFRRSVSRSAAASDMGTGVGGSIRSHSQPASRSPSVAPATGFHPLSSAQAAAVTNAAARAPMPSFTSDDLDGDDGNGLSESPLSSDGEHLHPRSMGRHGSTDRPPYEISFGDLTTQTSPERRRLSSDQLPQTLLDRRMRRLSRSPSPLGHARNVSNGTSSAPIVQAPFPGSQPSKPSRPAVVNGSGLRISLSAGPRSHSSDTAAQKERPLHTSTGTSQTSSQSGSGPRSVPEFPSSAQSAPVSFGMSPHPGIGYPPSEDPSFRERIAMMGAYYGAPFRPTGIDQATSGASTGPASPTKRGNQRNALAGAIAPLDLALSEEDRINAENMAHLSPVYETRTPSPTVTRMLDGSRGAQAPSITDSPLRNVHGTGAAAAPDTQKTQRGPNTQQQQAGSKPPGREQGHVRAAKSETDGSWQKAGKSKKKSNGGQAQGQNEHQPKHESDRKGG